MASVYLCSRTARTNQQNVKRDALEGFMLIAVEGILEMIFQMKFSVRIHREKY